MTQDLASRERQGLWISVLLVCVALMAMPFSGYALSFGARGLSLDLSGISRLFHADDPVATVAIFAHMITGGLLTGLAPVQLIPGLRRRWPTLHRWSGRVLVACALLTGASGLVYIALQGTIGGPHMSLGFAVYGGLMMLAAGQVLRHARAGRFKRHQSWALRLFVLAMGSWLYRVHYGIWQIATGGAETAPDFSGVFDQVQVFAFYLPYLALLEAVLWWRRRRVQRGG